MSEEVRDHVDTANDPRTGTTVWREPSPREQPRRSRFGVAAAFVVAGIVAFVAATWIGVSR